MRDDHVLSHLLGRGRAGVYWSLEASERGSVMSNSEMKPLRFYKLFMARRKFRDIAQHLNAGGRVQVSTYTRSVVYRSLDWFVLKGASVYVRRGRGLDCIDYSGIQFIN